MENVPSLYPGTVLSRVITRDAALLMALQRWRFPFATAFFRAASRLGDANSWILLWISLVAYGGITTRYAAIVSTSAGFATALSQACKRFWCRPRPSAGIDGFRPLTEDPDAFSFPSGHTSAAVAVAVALTGTNPVIGFAASCFALAVGISRIYLGVHYPLDVTAGAVLGAFAGLLTRFAIGH
jgi:undecaprenyl-diphosphatase